MTFDYNTIGPFITPVLSIIAIIISISSLGYTYHQNRRKMETDLWIDELSWINRDYQTIITLCGFNPKYRSVALMHFKLIVNNKPISIVEGQHKKPKSKLVSKDEPTKFKVVFYKSIEFPYILKEGEAVFLSINASILATFLYYNGFSGIVKLSGCFKTAQNETVKSKSTIDFNIEKYKEC